MRNDGVQAIRTLTLEPNRRLNIYCNDIPELAKAEFGVVVQSTNGVPIAVERATYWDLGRCRRHVGGRHERHRDTNSVSSD
jgi:hypothetical protein